MAKPWEVAKLLSVQLFEGCVFSRVGARSCMVGVVLSFFSLYFFFFFVVFLCASLLRGGSFDMLL